MNVIYSLIIPHYNIPDLLRRLLESVPKRNDLQIIVVDDCSVNKEELKKIMSDFPWVEFHSTHHRGGGGKARNIGLNHAKGRYIIFADADDFFEDAFDQILSDYSNKDFDIAYFKGSSCDSDSRKETFRTKHLNKFIDLYISGKDSQAVNLRYLFGEPWCKIIRKSIIDINNIQFDEVPIHNDTRFSYLIGFFAQNIIVDRRILYCVTTRHNSVSLKISEDRILTRIKVFSEAESFANSHSIAIHYDLHYIQLCSLFYKCDFTLMGKVLKIMRKKGISKFDILRNSVSAMIKIIGRKVNPNS